MAFCYIPVHGVAFWYLLFLTLHTIWPRSLCDYGHFVGAKVYLIPVPRTYALFLLLKGACQNYLFYVPERSFMHVTVCCWYSAPTYSPTPPLCFCPSDSAPFHSPPPTPAPPHSTFLGPKWHSPIGSMTFHRDQKSLDFQGPSPSHLPS